MPWEKGLRRPFPGRKDMAARQSWIGSIVIDCTDFGRMSAFWQEALHYTPREAPEPGHVVLTDPDGVGPNVALEQGSEAPLRDYRLHLDLYSSDPEGEVARLLRLGATLERAAAPGEDFVTLSDPDGNLFDIVRKEGWTVGRCA